MKKIFKIILIAVGIFFLISSCSKVEKTAFAAEEVGEQIVFSLTSNHKYESDAIYLNDYENNEITITASEYNDSSSNWNSLVGYLIVDVEGVLYNSGYTETVSLVFSSSGSSQTAKFSEGLEMFYIKAFRTITSSGISIKIDWTANYNAIGAGGYDEGYNDGYADGEDAGYTAGYSAGKWDGEEIGYNKGYSDALNANLDTAGIWAGTLALLTTFFNLTTTFFATRIAGDMTIGFFVIGIPVTIWIIELIIDLVVGWIRGGKKSSGGDDGGGVDDK